MESEYEEETDYQHGDEMFSTFRGHQMRLTIAFIGLLSALLPWFVAPSWYPGMSVNLVDILGDSNSGSVVAISAILYSIGLFLCALKDEWPLMFGGPMMLIGLIGVFVEFNPLTTAGLATGLGFYMAVAIGAIMAYLAVKEIREASGSLEPLP